MVYIIKMKYANPEKGSALFEKRYHTIYYRQIGLFYQEIVQVSD